MTDEQIEKALECCSGEIIQCEDCLYEELFGFECHKVAKRDALALIKRQREEIERLQIERDNFEVLWKDMKARNKDLFKYNDLLAKDRDELEIECDQIKHATVRNMQERLKIKMDTHTLDDRFARIFKYDVDQVAQEMMEE